MNGAKEASTTQTLRAISRNTSVVDPQRKSHKTGRFRILEALNLLHPLQKIISEYFYFGKTIASFPSNKKSNLLRQWQREQDKHFHDFKQKFSHDALQNVIVGDTVLKNARVDSGRAHALQIDLSNAKPPLEKGVFVINNNDVYRIGVDRYVNLYLTSPQSIFVIWDWDNHHALGRSMILAAFSDFYIPAHFDFFSQLADVSEAVSAPLWAATNQWSREFLQKNAARIMNVDRKEAPLGRHVSYPQFQRRAEILSKLNSVFPDVGPIGLDYHQLGELERLDEWCGHMAHWVVPVRNDVSIRIFDALITGGIPIVPRTLEHHPAFAEFRDHMVFYDAVDIEDPLPIAQRAVAKFKQGGVEGISMRFDLAMKRCHIDNRLREIVDRVSARYGPVADI